MTLPTLAIPGFDNLSHTVYTAASGRQAATDSSAVVLSNEDLAAINAIATALSGTLTVTANVGTGTQPVSGTITANAGTGTFAVSGTFWQATQPVSLTTLPALIAGSAVIGKVGIDQTTPGTTNALSLAYMGSTAVATGNGVVSAGVQRVSIASDNTAFSVNALQSGTWNITNVSGTVSLPTGAATSANQTTLNTNVGSSADGILTAGTAGSLSSYMRTVMEQSLSTTPAPVKIDQTTAGTTNAVSLGYVGSTAAASGNGVVGAGVLRVAVASDNTPFATKIDQTTDGTTNAVAVKNSPAANTAKTYTGSFVVAAQALTRPANTTAYTALDSISNNATAGSVTANSVTLSDTNDHPIDIAEILLDTTDTGPGTAAAKITIHLFNSDPTASTGVVGGDNAAWSNKKAGWVGSFSGTMTAFSDGSRGVLIPDAGPLRMVSPVSGAKTIYWQLQTQTNFTPSANSTTFTPTFKGFQSRPA